MSDQNGVLEHLPLAGVRVIEFGSLFAGPFSTRFLGDFGAEVIKLEPPGVGDPMRDVGPVKHKGRGLTWPTQSRNKKSITLDLRQPAGQALARRLVENADVVVENFRPGTMEKWGLGYEALKSINPGIVFVHVSGYGQSGPYKNRAGFGSAGGAMGGLRFLTGFPDLPPTRVGLSLEDSLASLQAVIGTLLALYNRDRQDRPTNLGQEVDVSILEAVFAMTEGTVTEYGLTGYVRQRSGTILPGWAPSNIYEAKDGIWMVIAANANNPFKRLFELMGETEIANDPKYQSHAGRWEGRALFDELISKWAKQYTSQEITELLEPAGVPSAPIYSAVEMLNDPHFRARELVVDVEDPELGSLPIPGIVPKLLSTPGVIKWTGPALGQHNDEVYQGILGLSDEEYADYRAKKVI